MKIVKEGEEQKQSKVKPVPTKYTSLIISENDKKLMREFKVKYMSENKIYKLSDISLFMGLIKFYEQHNNK